MRWYDSYCECVSRYIRDHTRLARGPNAIARIRGAIDDARRRERAWGGKRARASDAAQSERPGGADQAVDAKGR